MSQFLKYMLIFLTLLLLTACGDSESDYDKGLREGKSIGHSNGYYKGLREGKEEGYKDGFFDGNKTGFESGKIVGYKNGYFEGNQTGYHLGNLKGNVEGYNAGRYDKNIDLIWKNTIPILATVFILVIILIFLILFYIYFREYFIQKLKSIILSLKNIYIERNINYKLYIQKHHQAEILDLKAEIIAFKLKYKMQEDLGYSELSSDINFILNKVKLFLLQKQIFIDNEGLDIIRDYTNRTLSNSYLSSNGKNVLINEIDTFLSSKYLLDLNENQNGLEKDDLLIQDEIANEEFFSKNYHIPSKFNSIQVKKPISIKIRLLYWFLVILDIPIYIGLFYTFYLYYLGL